MSGKAAKIHAHGKTIRGSAANSSFDNRTQRLVQRVSVILMAFAGGLNVTIAAELGLARKQVGLWRRRWQQSYDALVAIECRESQAALRRTIEDVLSDAPRSGSTGTFTAEQVTQILAVACEPPEQSGRPIDRWTHRELPTKSYVARSCRPFRSAKSAAIWRRRNCNPTAASIGSTPKRKIPRSSNNKCRSFARRTWRLRSCISRRIRTRYRGRDARHSGLGADRQDDPDAARPAGADRIRIQATRDVVPDRQLGRGVGQMIAPTIRETRTDEDFAWHIHHTIQTDPEAGWVFVVDNLNIHC